MRQKTLIANFGMYKLNNGVLCSMLLCTRKINNNSAIRRRPIAFAHAPAMESTGNIAKSSEPIMQNLSLMKDNE